MDANNNENICHYNNLVVSVVVIPSPPTTMFCTSLILKGSCVLKNIIKIFLILSLIISENLPFIPFVSSELRRMNERCNVIRHLSRHLLTSTSTTTTTFQQTRILQRNEVWGSHIFLPVHPTASDHVTSTQVTSLRVKRNSKLGSRMCAARTLVLASNRDLLLLSPLA